MGLRALQSTPQPLHEVPAALQRLADTVAQQPRGGIVAMHELSRGVPVSLLWQRWNGAAPMLAH